MDHGYYNITEKTIKICIDNFTKDEDEDEV